MQYVCKVAYIEMKTFEGKHAQEIPLELDNCCASRVGLCVRCCCACECNYITVRENNKVIGEKYSVEACIQ